MMCAEGIEGLDRLAGAAPLGRSRCRRGAFPAPAGQPARRHQSALTPVIGFNSLLPVARIIETVDMQRFHFGDEDRIEWVTENKIQPVLWDSRWVPFSAFGGSPRLILDLRPGRNGTHGQVWQDWPGRDREDDRTVIAPTFAEFSTELLRWLTTGSVVVDDDGTLSFPRAGGYWLV
jgi:SMI1 / KNR4 family (SUKH-1)